MKSNVTAREEPQNYIRFNNTGNSHRQTHTKRGSFHLPVETSSGTRPFTIVRIDNREKRERERERARDPAPRRAKPVIISACSRSCLRSFLILVALLPPSNDVKRRRREGWRWGGVVEDDGWIDPLASSSHGVLECFVQFPAALSWDVALFLSPLSHLPLCSVSSLLRIEMLRYLKKGNKKKKKKRETEQRGGEERGERKTRDTRGWWWLRGGGNVNENDNV